MIKLKEKRTYSGETFKTGDTVTFNPDFERRLVKIGKAEWVHKPVGSVKELDIPFAQEIFDAGFETIEQVLAADLTTVKGIGEKKAEKIKDELRNPS